MRIDEWKCLSFYLIFIVDSYFLILSRQDAHHRREEKKETSLFIKHSYSMATPTRNRAFQAYNNYTFNNHPSLKKTPITTTAGEPLVFGHIPYSSIKTTVDKNPPTPPSPSPSNNLIKYAPVASKRRASTTSLSYFLPRRKSLQMTALASQRQSLWMSIAKNSQINDTPVTPLPVQQQTNLMRKKILRLLLVVSYLLSISLFAIALATFYGFFWTGYNSTQTPAHGSNVGSTISSIIPFKSNSTLLDIGLSLDDAS